MDGLLSLVNAPLQTGVAVGTPGKAIHGICELFRLELTISQPCRQDSRSWHRALSCVFVLPNASVSWIRLLWLESLVFGVLGIGLEGTTNLQLCEVFIHLHSHRRLGAKFVL